MTVALLPPLTSSCADWDGRTVPIFEAPRYMRGRGMSRWHRPRCGRRYADGRESLSFWCGFGVNAEVALTADAVPEPEPVCGTCEGRALGAGQDDTPAGMPRLAAVFGDGWAYQVFAPPSDHVNIHEHALHLFGRLDGKPVLPDFTEGTGSI